MKLQEFIVNHKDKDGKLDYMASLLIIFTTLACFQAICKYLQEYDFELDTDNVSK